MDHEDELMQTEGERIEMMQILHQVAKDAPKGTLVECPSCGGEFKKRHPAQAFCSNKGQGNCKDLFWNFTDPKRRDRAQMILDNLHQSC
jgi:predicted nucleic acid-binding Zn ribbon protein